MELYIIRHAQSYNNALTDWTERVSDPPLTELGERQADVLAAHLASTPAEAEQAWFACLHYVNRTGFRFTRLFTSAMRRSLQTAAPIGQAIGLEPEVWVDIHEIGGVFLDDHEGRGLPGLKRAEMAAQFPTIRLSPEVTEEGWWNRQRETEEEWLERAARVAEMLRERYAATDERIGLVTHGGFAAMLIYALFGHAKPGKVILSHRNTGITRLDFDRSGMNLMQYYNRVEHLPSALLS